MSLHSGGSIQQLDEAAPLVARTPEPATLTEHLQRCLDHYAPPLVSFAEGGSIVAVNRTASAILERLGNTSNARLATLRPPRLRAAIVRAMREKLRVPQKSLAVDEDLIAIITSDGDGPIVDVMFLSHAVHDDLHWLARTFALSRREREITALLVDGKANSAIASSLGIGVETVKTYRSRIYAKLDIRSRTELLRKVYHLRSSAAQ